MVNTNFISFGLFYECVSDKIVVLFYSIYSFCLSTKDLPHSTKIVDAIKTELKVSYENTTKW